VKQFLPESGEKILDAASGPIQYEEYLEYSRNFQIRTCVDISASALAQAQNRLGKKGEYVKASLLELPFSESTFDAAISMHTIYHIEKDAQGKAVRELIRVTKPDAPLVIIYANPNKFLTRIKHLFKPAHEAGSGTIYYHAHPLEWWKQFEDQASVRIHTWRSLSAQDARRFIPGNRFGKWIYAMIFKWESMFDSWACAWGAYPIVVIKKRS
jgi:ubiquinone/menaquinone biosynthesis C-methylase UbiE